MPATISPEANMRRRTPPSASSHPPMRVPTRMPISPLCRPAIGLPLSLSLYNFHALGLNLDSRYSATERILVPHRLVSPWN
jgi:hypothetical protein